MLKFNCARIECDACGRHATDGLIYVAAIGFDHPAFVLHRYTDYIQCRPCFEISKKKHEEAKSGRSFKQWFFNLPDFYEFCPNFKGWIAKD